jgi:DNA-binding GntR family transcriptional regulator
MAKLNRLSLPDQVYEDLKWRIISLELPLGSRLNASELQRFYSVSSTPIREALNRLTRDGLIAYTNNVGAQVISLTPQDIIEISEVGFALRAEAVRLTMRRGLSSALADSLEAYIKAYAEVADQEDLRSYILKIERSFFDRAGNSRLVDTIIGMAPQMDLLQNLFIKALQEHKMDFLEKIRDYEKVCNLIRQDNADEAILALEELCYHGAQLAQLGLELVIDAKER